MGLEDIMGRYPQLFGKQTPESINARVKSEKILEIKKNLTIDSHPVIKRVHDTLVKNKFPVDNFLKNLSELELRHIAVDSIADSSYIASKNILYYRNDEELYHELSHMASTDYASRLNGLADMNKHTIAINEGMTDYIARLANPLHELAYPMEYYVVSILQKIFKNDIFKSYFKSDVKTFLKDIKDNDVKALIITLDVYADEINKLIENDKKFVSDKIMVLAEVSQVRSDLRNLVVKIMEYLNILVKKYNIDMNVYKGFIDLLEDGMDNSVAIIESLTLYEPL